MEKQISVSSEILTRVLRDVLASNVKSEAVHYARAVYLLKSLLPDYVAADEESQELLDWADTMAELSTLMQSPKEVMN